MDARRDAAAAHIAKSVSAKWRQRQAAKAQGSRRGADADAGGDAGTDAGVSGRGCGGTNWKWHPAPGQHEGGRCSAQERHLARGEGERSEHPASREAGGGDAAAGHGIAWHAWQARCSPKLTCTASRHALCCSSLGLAGAPHLGPAEGRGPGGEQPPRAKRGDGGNGGALAAASGRKAGEHGEAGRAGGRQGRRGRGGLRGRGGIPEAEGSGLGRASE